MDTSIATVYLDALHARDVDLVRATCTEAGWGAGDSPRTLMERCVQGGFRLARVGDADVRGRRAAVAVVLVGADGPVVRGWLLLRDDTSPAGPRLDGATLHDGVAALFLAGHVDGTLDWGRLPQSDWARAWFHRLIQTVPRGALEALRRLELLAAGARITLEGTLALGTAPRAAIRLSFQTRPELPPVARWVVLDRAPDGEVTVRSEGPTLDVGDFAADIAGVPPLVVPPLPRSPLLDALEDRVRAAVGDAPLTEKDAAWLETNGGALAAALVQAMAEAAIEAAGAHAPAGPVRLTHVLGTLAGTGPTDRGNP